MALEDSFFYNFCERKILDIHHPGEISFRYNPVSNNLISTKLVCFPVGFLRDLIKKTKMELNNKEFDFLFYKIGKDYAKRFFYPYENLNLSNENKIKFLKDFSKYFYFFGEGVFENIYFNNSLKKIIFCGNCSSCCQVYEIPSFLSGFISGFVSFIFGENMETNYFFDNKRLFHKIIADTNLKEKYKSNILFEKNYFYLKNKTIKQHPSFCDFIKFRLIKINENKLIFNNFEINFFEFGFLSIILDNYSKLKLNWVFLDIIKNFFKDFISKLFLDDLSNFQKILRIQKLFSGFGWGILHFQEFESEIFLDLDNSFFSIKNDFFIQIFFQEVLNLIYFEKWSFEKKIVLGIGRNRFIYKKYNCGTSL